MDFEIDNFSALKEALRRMCAELSEGDVPDGVVFESKVVANELLVNALQYGGGRAYFNVRREEGTIRIAVRGERAFCPPERAVCSDADAERGRGLFLVDALSARRTYSESEGTIVILTIS